MLAPDALRLSLPVGSALDDSLGPAGFDPVACVPLALLEPEETLLQKTPWPSGLVSIISLSLSSAASKAVAFPAWYESLSAQA